MKSIFRKILDYFTTQDEYKLAEFERNEICFCGSGKKYKNCHLIEFRDNGKITLHKVDLNGNNIGFKIVSKRKYKHLTIRMKTTLNGADVGGPPNLIQN